MDDYSVETKTVPQSSGTVVVTPNGDKIPGGGVMTHAIADRFFATRGDNLVRAFQDIKTHHFNEDLDGELLGRWVITEISYWNRDKERLLLLGTKCILLCKYDFVAMKMGMVQRVLLSQIKQVQKGEFDLPPSSWVTPRLYEGIRMSWGSMDEKWWFQRWNPIHADIPFVTLTSHPVLSLPDIEGQNFYDIDGFYSALKEAMADKRGVNFIENQPIVIETYAGVGSFVHNQSRLGFSRERGGISF